MVQKLKAVRTFLRASLLPIVGIVSALAWFPVAAQAAPSGGFTVASTDSTSSYYICLYLASTECIVSEGPGNQVETLPSGGWSHFHFISLGGNLVYIENANNNCLRENNSNEVTIANGKCVNSDAGAKWIQSGTSSITYQNYTTGDFMETRGDTGNMYVEAKPAMQGYYRGWQLLD